jgi:hypothetical protein
MRYIDADALVDYLQYNLGLLGKPDADKEPIAHGCYIVLEDMLVRILTTHTADVVEVEKVSEQIIRKKAEVTEYWKNDVKQYRALKDYSDIEHDTDNFLRGYNEAVEDMLAILGGARMDGDEDD